MTLDHALVSSSTALCVVSAVAWLVLLRVLAVGSSTGSCFTTSVVWVVRPAGWRVKTDQRSSSCGCAMAEDRSTDIGSDCACASDMPSTWVVPYACSYVATGSSTNFELDILHTFLSNTI